MSRNSGVGVLRPFRNSVDPSRSKKTGLNHWCLRYCRNSVAFPQNLEFCLRSYRNSVGFSINSGIIGVYNHTDFLWFSGQ
jgi:hypothetical protein